MISNFTENEDDSAEKLNKFLHGLLGYETEESSIPAWNLIPSAMFELALDAIFQFQELHANNFIASLWLLKIEKFTSRGECQFKQTAPCCEPSKAQAKPVNESQPSSKALPAWKRYAHSAGGSSNIVVTGRTKLESQSDLKLNYYNSVVTKLDGLDAILKLRQSWAIMDTKYGDLKWE